MLNTSKKLDLGETRVLVVDDNPQSSGLIVQMFLGFRARRPVVCGSAAEARSRLSFERFDLLIVDCQMPGEDGISLVRAVRAAPDLANFTVPIILVSANTPLEKIVAGRDAGANLVMKKPIAAPSLLSRIEWLARTNRAFVNCEAYRGPDRRFRTGAPPQGISERRASTLALAADPTRALSQGDVDSLFG